MLTSMKRMEGYLEDIVRMEVVLGFRIGVEVSFT
jgi:hypothetical protein